MGERKCDRTLEANGELWELNASREVRAAWYLTSYLLLIETLLDIQKSESHAPRSYCLIFHWRGVEGAKVTSILARSCAARGR